MKERWCWKAKGGKCEAADRAVRGCKPSHWWRKVMGEGMLIVRGEGVETAEQAGVGLASL